MLLYNADLRTVDSTAWRLSNTCEVCLVQNPTRHEAASEAMRDWIGWKAALKALQCCGNVRFV